MKRIYLPSSLLHVCFLSLKTQYLPFSSTEKNNIKSLLPSIALVLFFLTGAASLQATILTVSNDANNPAQYTTIQAAHDAAANGDTLYIYGSATSYGAVSVSKKITMIGNGYAPLAGANNNGFPTQIASISLSENVGLGTSSSNSVFKSITVNSTLNADNFIIVAGITIDRCKINFLSGSSIVNSNWLITNSEIKTCTLSAFSNLVMANCIFSRDLIITDINNSVLISQSEILTISSNIYEGIVFQNNIFYGIDFSTSANFSYCTFTNNLTFADGTASPLPIGINNNTGANNIEDSDPMFVQFDEVAGCGSSCIDNEDYHLQGGSPAIGAGLGGNDLGIYDGNFPWPDVTGHTGTPPIPEVTGFNVINSVVVPGEKVKFDASAETRN